MPYIPVILSFLTFYVVPEIYYRRYVQSGEDVCRKFKCVKGLDWLLKCLRLQPLFLSNAVYFLFKDVGWLFWV